MLDGRTRREFLAAVPGTVLAALGAAFPLVALERSRRAGPDHPDPRPGIDASRVLKAEDLHNPAAASVYDMVREIPQVVDGIRCHCGCADVPGYYSLLTCYEDGGMAQDCTICQGQAKVVYKGHQQGHTLDEIRALVDFRYG